MLTLIRGLPGSGKTTLAKTFANNSLLIAADDFFSQDFDPRYLKEAHRWCRDETRSMLMMGKNVVVHNTFTRRWEMQPYFEIAQEANVEIQVISLYDAGLSDEALAARNQHDVPVETIRRMRERWEGQEEVIRHMHKGWRGDRAEL